MRSHRLTNPAISPMKSPTHVISSKVLVISELKVHKRLIRKSPLPVWFWCVVSHAMWRNSSQI
jgi:hypothetical protein